MLRYCLGIKHLTSGVVLYCVVKCCECEGHVRVREAGVCFPYSVVTKAYQSGLKAWKKNIED